MTDSPLLLPVGAPAPDFSANTTDGETVSLREFRDHRAVLLMFYPKDDTPGCTRQMCSARDEGNAFEAASVARFGVNPGSLESHRRFRDKYNLDFPLIVDAEKRIAEAYGVLNENGGIQRATYLVGMDGRVLFAESGAHGATAVLEVARA